MPFLKLKTTTSNNKKVTLDLLSEYTDHWMYVECEGSYTIVFDSTW